jgi:hypothetical protein
VYTFRARKRRPVATDSEQGARRPLLPLRVQPQRMVHKLKAGLPVPRVATGGTVLKEGAVDVLGSLAWPAPVLPGIVSTRDSPGAKTGREQWQEPPATQAATSPQRRGAQGMSKVSRPAKSVPSRTDSTAPPAVTDVVSMAGTTTGNGSSSRSVTKKGTLPEAPTDGPGVGRQDSDVDGDGTEPPHKAAGAASEAGRVEPPRSDAFGGGGGCKATPDTSEMTTHNLDGTSARETTATRGEAVAEREVASPNAPAGGRMPSGDGEPGVATGTTNEGPKATSKDPAARPPEQMQLVLSNSPALGNLPLPPDSVRAANSAAPPAIDMPVATVAAVQDPYPPPTRPGDASSDRTQPLPLAGTPSPPGRGDAAEPMPDEPSERDDRIIHPFHIALFSVLLLSGITFAIVVLNFTTDMGWMWSSMRVLRKLSKGLAFRQTIALLMTVAFVRYGLEPLVRTVRSFFMLPTTWERSNEYFLLKQVCPPAHSAASFKAYCRRFKRSLVAVCSL